MEFINLDNAELKLMLSANDVDRLHWLLKMQPLEEHTLNKVNG